MSQICIAKVIIKAYLTQNDNVIQISIHALGFLRTLWYTYMLDTLSVSPVTGFLILSCPIGSQTYS